MTAVYVAWGSVLTVGGLLLALIAFRRWRRERLLEEMDEAPWLEPPADLEPWFQELNAPTLEAGEASQDEGDLRSAIDRLRREARAVRSEPDASAGADDVL